MESFISALIYFHNGVLHISTIDMWELFHLHRDLSASPPLCSCCQAWITGCLRSSRSFLPHLFCPIEADLYRFRQSVCRQSFHHLDHHHHHLCAASPLAAALPNLHHNILYSVHIVMQEVAGGGDYMVVMTCTPSLFFSPSAATANASLLNCHSFH